MSGHFSDKDIRLREIYEHIIESMRPFGPLRIEAVKSAINVAAKYNFSSIKVAKDHLRVEFLLDHLVESDRIIKTEQLGGSKIAYHVRINNLGDVDQELIGWLGEAYRLRR